MKKWQTCLLGVGSICCLAACSAKNMSDEATMKEQTKQNKSVRKLRLKVRRLVILN